MGLAKIIGKTLGEVIAAPITIPAETIKQAEKSINEALKEDNEKSR